MKKLMTVLCFLVVAAVTRAEGGFTKTLTPDEQAAAGLNKLTAEELARLEAVVERYKSGEVAVVQQQAEQKVAVTEAKAKEAEQKAAIAEAKVQEVAAKSTAAAPAGKKKPGWLTALITLKQTEEKPDKAEAFETHIAGDFDGWSGNTTFKLENGQVWQQNGGDSYYGDRQHSPRVKIYPGLFGSYWMDVENVRQRVKVKPIHLE
ncbi:MAG: hypothetical protein HYV95_03955 [Opitutae bacterium]|nr:hypothetical protein [Opitutae bacterium]